MTPGKTQQVENCSIVLNSKLSRDMSKYKDSVTVVVGPVFFATTFVTPKVIATFYTNLKLTILTLHFITISSVSCTI